jgi:hypothetical protein
MDEFDFKEEKPKKKLKVGNALWNVASLLTLIATLCTGGFLTQIFLNPQGGLNPLPPATTAAPVSPTATNELIPTVAVPTETATQEPSATPEPPTQFFGIQEGSPVALDSSVFHPELGCNFLGVAGQIFGADGAPISGLRVWVSGTLAGAEVSELGVTGTATQYGDGAYYEIQLADAPTVTEGTLRIAVLGEGDQPLSSATTFSTTDSCQENLILINFNEQQ